MAKLEGKIALVTGGSSGIGLATAKRFVCEGAYVFITGRRDTELAAAVKEIGKNVTGIQGAVSNLGDLDRLFAQIKREKGKLDIVFANAGIARYAALGIITEEGFDSIFNTNVKGVLFTVQKALPLLPDGASIILNASIVGSKGLPSNSVYSATKAAVRSFARTWTTDLKARRIRVNAVSPGAIDTPGLNDLWGSSEVGQERIRLVSTVTPLGRLGTPDEVAKAVVFLASDDSSYITGSELFVDGGFAQNMSEPIYPITGVTGATGGAAARELREQGHRVRGLIHKDEARAEALRALGIETVAGDLLDLDSTLPLRAAVDPAVRCRDGEGRVQRVLRSAHRQRGAGLPGRHFRGHERRHRNDHWEAALTLEEFVSRNRAKFTV